MRTNGFPVLGRLNVRWTARVTSQREHHDRSPGKAQVNQKLNRGHIAKGEQDSWKGNGGDQAYPSSPGEQIAGTGDRRYKADQPKRRDNRCSSCQRNSPEVV